MEIRIKHNSIFWEKVVFYICKPLLRPQEMLELLPLDPSKGEKTNSLGRSWTFPLDDVPLSPGLRYSQWDKPRNVFSH